MNRCPPERSVPAVVGQLEVDPARAGAAAAGLLALPPVVVAPPSLVPPPFVPARIACLVPARIAALLAAAARLPFPLLAVVPPALQPRRGGLGRGGGQGSGGGAPFPARLRPASRVVPVGFVLVPALALAPLPAGL